MKSNLLNFFLTIILAIILGMFLPWWSIMVAALCIGFLFPLKGLKVFLIPFFAIFLYWIIYSYILGSTNDFTLTKKIGVLFTLGENWILVILITGLMGGLASGVSGVFGQQIHILVKGKS